MSMTGSYSKAEVLPGPERRRSWSTAEKLSIVQETYEWPAPIRWPGSNLMHGGLAGDV